MSISFCDIQNKPWKSFNDEKQPHKVKKVQNGHFARETGGGGKLGSVAVNCARERSQRAKYKM